MLPKPKYTGGSPASRNASSSGDSGRWSGRIHAPVWNTSRSEDPGQGANVGSAASHGLSVKMWLRTSATGSKPADARCELRATPQESFQRCASCAQSLLLSAVPSAGESPRHAGGGWCAEGTDIG